MRTLEAVLGKHLNLQLHIFDANTAAKKNWGGYFLKENDPASGFMVVPALGYYYKYSKLVMKELFGEYQFFIGSPNTVYDPICDQIWEKGSYSLSYSS